jgi:hypothetical protein
MQQGNHRCSQVNEDVGFVVHPVDAAVAEPAKRK